MNKLLRALALLLFVCALALYLVSAVRTQRAFAFAGIGVMALGAVVLWLASKNAK